MSYNCAVIIAEESNVHGYPIDASEGFTITRGARNPETFESIGAARATQRALPGSTLTYKVTIPERERLEVMARLAVAYPARKPGKTTN